jgi:hypothetical protein
MVLGERLIHDGPRTPLSRLWAGRISLTFKKPLFSGVGEYQ